MLVYAQSARGKEAGHAADKRATGLGGIQLMAAGRNAAARIQK